MSRPPASRGTCPHCHKPIVWARLQNGRYRGLDPDPSGAGTDPADTYAYSRTLRAFVDLVGVLRPPREANVVHRCEEYWADRELAGVDAVWPVALGALAETVGGDRRA